MLRPSAEVTDALLCHDCLDACRSFSTYRKAWGTRLCGRGMAPSPLSPQRFSIAARLRSFRFAWAGVRHMLRHQHNAQIHLLITVAVCAAGAGIGLDRTEWLWIVLAIALVWVAEAFNTAFEYLCDVVEPDFHHGVEKAKDIAAGAVLIAAVAAAALGGLVFWPHLSLPP